MTQLCMLAGGSETFARSAASQEGGLLLLLLSVQRGFIGRYPLHFHKMGDCPECEFIGNAVVGSTQRGIVIHSTHSSTVLRNVVFGVKGAFLYVEEGVEMNNTIQVC